MSDYENFKSNDEDDDDLVTLVTADGKELDFIEVAGIAYKGHFYAILQPVEPIEGMDDDEALVFEVTKDEDGEDKFEMEQDDNIIDAVFKEYNKLLDKAAENAATEGKNTGKGRKGSRDDRDGRKSRDDSKSSSDSGSGSKSGGGSGRDGGKGHSGSSGGKSKSKGKSKSTGRKGRGMGLVAKNVSHFLMLILKILVIIIAAGDTLTGVLLIISGGSTGQKIGGAVMAVVGIVIIVLLVISIRKNRRK